MKTRSLIALVLAVVPLAAFAVQSPLRDRAQWMEEVRLHDGAVVQVERSAEAKTIGFPESRGRQLATALAYRQLDVEWRAAGTDMPLSFDVIRGTAYLVVLSNNSACGSGKKFAARYWAGKSGVLEEVAEGAVPFDELTVNLYARYWGNTAKEDATGLITLEQKYRHDPTSRNRPLLEFFKNNGLVCATRRGAP